MKGSRRRGGIDQKYLPEAALLYDTYTLLDLIKNPEIRLSRRIKLNFKPDKKILDELMKKGYTISWKYENHGIFS